ncbi:BTB/POZ fold [Penicillium roqueforti FM164]|uniref:BTB/POZ fold n=1 Tax=Penicillium roqueforti (strain FM164) TaxID=1365484 RepID=W6Q7Y3_PENRF|nr:BTB/POZ fold [Penicillium roqueforti FM164]
MAPRQTKSLRGLNLRKSTSATPMASTQEQEDTKPILTAVVAPDLHPPYQVDPDGDIILFTPKTPLIDISKGNVPGNYARFQVSSKHLALASAYFKRLLKDCWAEGSALSKKGSVEIPVNDCKPDILLVLLNLIHGRSRQVPLKLTLPQLSDIAVATDFFQCNEVVEVFAGIWIQALESLVPSSFSQDMKIWMMISCVFRSHSVIFQKTTKIAIQQATGPFDTSNLPIPNSIKGIQN